MLWVGWLVFGAGLLAWLLVGCWVLKAGEPPAEPPEVEELVATYPQIYILQRSDDGAPPEYAIIDFQTTGLSTVEGREDRIVQTSWLVVDAQMKEQERGLRIVRQKSLGSKEARKVHRVTSEQMAKFGRPEKEVLEELWQDVKDVPYWVFHNASFDLAILLGAVRRIHPEWEEVILQKATICTMRYLQMVYDPNMPFYNLIELTHQLTHISRETLTQMNVISWRNVCLTRVSLYILLRDFPDPEGERGALPACEFIF